MKTLIMAVLMVISLVVAAAGETVDGYRNVYTLAGLYRLALKRSEQVGISKEDLFLAEQTRKKAFSVLVPELSAFGTHTRYLFADSIADVFSDAGGSGGDMGFESPDSTTTWGLELSQAFTLNGKELIALEITEDSIEKSEYDLSSVKEEFLFGVAAAYFNVLKAGKAFDIATANVDRLTTYRDAVVVKLELEEVEKTDMFRTEAELSSAKAELLAAENSMKYARAVLSQLAGLEGKYSVKDPEAFIDPTEDNGISELKAIAHNHRTELKSMEKQQAIAEKQVKYYRSEYWPTVSLNGSYSKTEASPSDALVMSREDFSVALTLSFSLFDGGLKKARVGEAMAWKRQADLGYRSEKKQIDLEVEQSYLSVTSAKSVLDALEDQVTYARSNYDAVLKQFQYGVANSVDIMDANTLLVTAERQLSDAGYTYQLAIIKLNRSQGVFLSGVEML
jgi:outer membrane protein